MNKDNPISVQDCQKISNLCNKIQNDINKNKSYLLEDQNNLFKLLDNFKGKYSFLSEHEIVYMFPIPKIVIKRLQLI